MRSGDNSALRGDTYLAPRSNAATITATVAAIGDDGITAADLWAQLQHSLSASFECQTRPRGDVRVRTPFLLPDRDFVDIFVQVNNREVLITDFGLALSWLRGHSATGTLSPPIRDQIEEFMQTLDVRLHRSQFELQGSTEAEIGLAIHKLGQAVVRVADLFRMMRTQTIRSVSDDVEYWLDDATLT